VAYGDVLVIGRLRGLILRLSGKSLTHMWTIFWPQHNG